MLMVYMGSPGAVWKGLDPVDTGLGCRVCGLGFRV